MNKFVNILQLLVLLPTMVLTIFVGFDLPVEFLRTSGANLPYLLEVFSSLAAVIGLIGARRAIRRWMGVRLVSQIQRFVWNIPMGPGRMKQAALYLQLEALTHFAVATALYLITDKAWPAALVYLLLGAEHVAFLIYARSKNAFRLGLTRKALVVADRETKVLYFSGLRKVSVHQQSVFFDYTQELQLSFPVNAVPEASRKAFFHHVEENVNRDKVFFEDSFKRWS